MNRFVIIGIVASLYFCFFAHEVRAARAMTILGNKSSLFGDEEVTITASASGFTQGETIYVKGALYKEGSTNYSGYTQNGDSWVKNGTSTTSQRQVKIGEWDNLLLFKVNFSDSGYQGEGDYNFKVGFYYTTGTGALSSVNWSSVLVLAISEPDPTPTDTPTPTANPTATPTSAPIATTIPTKSPTSTPTPTANITQTVATASPTLADDEDSTDSGVLGEATASAEKNAEESNAHQETVGSNSSRSKLPYVFMVSGFLFMGACGILVYLNYFRKL